MRRFRAAHFVLTVLIGFAGCRGLVVDEKNYVADAGSSGGSAGSSAGDSGIDTSVSDAGPDVASDAASEPDVPSCKSGPAATCPPGKGDCNACADDGCETDLTKSSDHCGQCGRSCRGQKCAFRMCEPEVLTQVDLGDWIWSIDVDELYVYFPSYQVNGIGKILKSGGPLESVDPTAEENGGIKVDAQFVYILGLYLELKRVSKLGGVPQPLGDLSAKAPNFLGNLVIDDKYVYFTDHDPGGFLAKVPLTGGTVTYLLENGVHAGLTLDQDFLYVVTTDALRRVGKDGSNPTDIVPEKGVQDVAVDESFAYFSMEDGFLYRVPKSGGSKSVIPSFNSGKQSLHVTKVRIYWRTNSTVESTLKDGSQPIADVLAINQPYTTRTAVAIDDEFIYWLGANRWMYRTPLY